MNQDASSHMPTFNPGHHPVLYHYCSTSTFLSIIQRKCLWLSDVNTMNDFGEVHWAYERFIEAANLVLKDVGLGFIELVDHAVTTSQSSLLPTLCAFSTDGDVLSQWRAYAEDGTGVAIGFSAEKIASLSVRVAPIEYSKDAQVSHFRTWLLAAFEVFGSLPENEKTSFLSETGAQLSMDMAFYKNPAFSEEKEVRIMRALTARGSENSQWTLTDPGGSGEKFSRKRLTVQYRAARNGGLVAYVELPLTGLGTHAIKEPVVGPKSPSGRNEMSMALNALGFKDVTIRHSTATYR